MGFQGGRVRYGPKSSVFIALMCITSHRIPASASTDQGPEKRRVETVQRAGVQPESSRVLLLLLAKLSRDVGPELNHLIPVWGVM